MWRRGHGSGAGERAQQRDPKNITFDGAPPPPSSEMVAVGLLLASLRRAPIWAMLRPGDQGYVINLLRRGLMPYVIFPVDDRLAWATLEADHNPENWGRLRVGPEIPTAALLVRIRHGLWRIVDDGVSSEKASRWRTVGQHERRRALRC
jgi:hypothetical protein